MAFELKKKEGTKKRKNCKSKLPKEAVCVKWFFFPPLQILACICVTNDLSLTVNQLRIRPQ